MRSRFTPVLVASFGFVFVSSLSGLAGAQDAVRTAHVRFEADDARAELQRQEVRWTPAGWESGWTPVCRERCEGELDPRFTYRVDGSGIRASRELSLQPGASEHLRVETAAGYRRPLGISLLASGGALAGLGLLSALAAPSMGEQHTDRRGDSQLQGAMLGVAAVGAAVAITGLVFLASSTTHVRRGSEVAPQAPDPRASAPSRF